MHTTLTQLKAIALTVAAMAWDCEPGRQAGVSEYLTKTIRATEIILAITATRPGSTCLPPPAELLGNRLAAVHEHFFVRL